jgi:hypothetical protein
MPTEKIVPEKEATKVAAAPDQPIPTGTPEPTPSEETVEPTPDDPDVVVEDPAPLAENLTPTPGVPDSEIVEEAPPPTPQAILEAIQLLTSLQANAEGEVSEGEPGDIFLCYDISLRIQGEKTFRIKSSRCLHGILLPEGIPSATAEMESALFGITQPIKQKLMGVVGRLTTHVRGDIPRPKLEFKG